MSKEENKSFNPQLVHMVAADAFWNYVYQKNLEEAHRYINEGNFPKEMLSPEIIKDILLKYVSEVPDFIINSFCEAVAQDIIEHHRAERNLLGMVYEEDIKNGITPDFIDHKRLRILNDDSDEMASYQIQIDPDNIIPTMGTLLIRTPLPAVAITSKLPHRPLILVESTERALGFKKTIIMNINSFRESSSGYILEGIFRIPTTLNKEANKNWVKIIPNSTAFLNGLSLYADEYPKIDIRLIDK